MATHTRQRTFVRTESVAHIEVPAPASETLSGTITAAELGLVDQRQLSGTEGVPQSGIDGGDVPDIQQTPVVPARPQLKLANPDCPVRYIPIHIWWVFCALGVRGQGIHSGFHLSFAIFRPEHLNKVQPRTGRRYCPKRSRTFPKRNATSPRTLRPAVSL